MAMPTTRRGRFLFYRQRQRRRLGRLRKRYPTKVGRFTVFGENMTGRMRDLSAFWKQEPREYPLNPSGVIQPPVSVGSWRVKPARGVFGVIEFTPPPGSPETRGYNSDSPILDYQKRRLKSVPRLKHIPRLPWAYTLAEVSAGSHYWDVPEFYPSGQPNPWYIP